MDKLFLSVLNMSITGAFVIAAVCVARLTLKKAPKNISYCLWAVVGFRLVFPFSINSIISLIPFRATPIPQNIVVETIPRIDSGITVIDNVVNNVLPASAPYNSANPLQIWIIIGASLWLVGAIIMSIYGIKSYFLLKRKMRASKLIEANIYEANNIHSPFLLGIINPKIFIPTGLKEQEQDYVICHERIHLRRRDHIVKLIAYFILCLHWFNPFAWIAFIFMGADMEMSCDEQVLKEMGGEAKRGYSLSLLSLATERRFIGGSPLTFSEGGMKERVKNVLNYRKHSKLVITAAVILAAALSAGFAVNRNGLAQEISNTPVEHRFDSFSSLSITTVSGNIIILSGGNQLVVQYDELIENEYTLSENSGDIEISQDNFPLHSSGYSTIKITIPTSMSASKINIKTVSSSININGATVSGNLSVYNTGGDTTINNSVIGNTLTIGAAGGEASINNVTANGDLTIHSANCKADISNSTFGGTITVSSADGITDVTNCRYSKLDISTASGSGTVNLPDSAQNYNIIVTPGTINNYGVSSLGNPEFIYNGKQISYEQLQNSSSNIPIKFKGADGTFTINDYYNGR